MSVRVLIVDDEKSQRHTLSRLIQRQMGFETMEAENGHEGLTLLHQNEKNNIGLIILDLQMPIMNGMETLEALLQQNINIPVIMLTSDSDIKSVIKAMKSGAADFLTKPIQPDRMIVSIRNALKMNSLKNEVTRLHKKEEGNFLFSDLIGYDTGLAPIVQKGRKAASSHIPVLLTGETGVGKEVFARAIHGESSRARKPFIAVNCGALPVQLVESILFGHEKGAFTGAVAKTIGKFREAHGGTIFLDEVGELPFDTQVKLLRVLQQKEVEPVGSSQTVPVDVRIISATNRELNAEIQLGNFREDLYYRLNVLPIEILPLRERHEDISMLANHFVERFSVLENKEFQYLTKTVQEFLENNSWQGNIRELENAVHRAVVLSENTELTIEDFTDVVEFGTDSCGTRTASPFNIPMFDEDGALKTLEILERDALQIALRYHDNNITRTAKALGIAKSTFYRKTQNDI